jgi:membrane dipeptidase
MTGGKAVAGSEDIAQRARDIIAQSIVWDNHSCLPLRADDSFLPQLERCRRAGYTAITLNIGFDLTPFEQNVRVLAHFRHWVEMHGDDYVLIGGPQDIVKAKSEGRLAIGFDLEGTRAIADQLSMIALFRELGVQWMLMAYNKNNSVGGGCMDDDEGLSVFGRAVLDEMMRVGMIPCCSHAGWKTAREVIDHVGRPVIFSHSNAHAVYAHARNIPDDLIRACADTGGVIGINGVSRFLGNDSTATLDWFRHLDHVVQLVGPDHAGIALDYVWDLQEVADFIKQNPATFPADGGYSRLSSYIEPERISDMVVMMLEHGYPQDAIAKILGLNHLRVANYWAQDRPLAV